MKVLQYAKTEHASSSNARSVRGFFIIFISVALVFGLWSTAVSDPVTEVEPDNLYFAPTDNSLTFVIRNAGDGTMTWSLASDKTWLTVNPVSGTTATEADQITVTVDRTGIAAGYHTGTITVNSDGGNKTVSVKICVKNQVDQWPFIPKGKAHCYNHGIGGYQWVGPLFHGAIDLPKVKGTDVYSVVAGVLRHKTASGQNGGVWVSKKTEMNSAWQHYHLDNIPVFFRDIESDGVANATDIGLDTKIGKVYDWTGGGGVVDHLHLKKVTSSNWFIKTIINPLHELSSLPTMAAKLAPMLFKKDTDDWAKRPLAHDFNKMLDGARVIKDDVDIVDSSTTQVSECAGAEMNKAEVNSISYKVTGLRNVAGHDISQRCLMDWTVISANFDNGDKAKLVYDLKHHKNNNKYYFNHFLVTNCGNKMSAEIRGANDATINVMKNAWQTAVKDDANDDDEMTGPTGTDDPRAPRNAKAKYPDGRYRVTTRARVFPSPSGSELVEDWRSPEVEQVADAYVNNFSQTIDPNKSMYLVGEPVYVTGTQYQANKAYTIYLIKKDAWPDHAPIPHGTVVTVTNVTSDGNGIIPLTKIWNAYAPNGIPDKGYDIVVDYDKDGEYHLPRNGQTIDALNHINSFPKLVPSSRFVVELNNMGGIGTIVDWWHGEGTIHAGYDGSLILGTEPGNLALACGATGERFYSWMGWIQDTLYFERTVPGGEPVVYKFPRHRTIFRHPTLPLEIELFAIGAFDPEWGPCEDAVWVKYVIHNIGEEPIDSLEKALYIDLDIEPYAAACAVGGVEEFGTIWSYNVAVPNILFGMTQKPVYVDGGACGGFGVSLPYYVYPQSGWDMDTLKAIMNENPWDMDRAGDQPTDVGIMLIDYPFSLNPSERYCNEYIIWAYDKDNPINGLTFGQFLYELMKQEGYYRGDVNCDGNCDIIDIVYLVNYAFKGGSGPLPFDDQGDVNCDSNVDVVDIVYLVGYVFKQGPPPIDKNRFFDEPYKTMFSRRGLVNDPVWMNLPFLDISGP